MVISIYYDPIFLYILSSVHSILSVSSVVVQFIALHHTYAYETVCILVVYVIYTVSHSYTV